MTCLRPPCIASSSAPLPLHLSDSSPSPSRFPPSAPPLLKVSAGDVSLSTRRTCFLLLFSPWPMFAGVSNALEKAPLPEYPPKTDLIQKLLEKSRANKAKNDQERLDDYYERNYKDYFEFLEGTIRNKSNLTETEKGILKWLDKARSKGK